MARWGRKERQQPAEEEISMIKMDAFHFFESPRPIDFDFRREFATFLTTGLTKKLDKIWAKLPTPTLTSPQAINEYLTAFQNHDEYKALMSVVADLIILSDINTLEALPQFEKTLFLPLVTLSSDFWVVAPEEALQTVRSSCISFRTIFTDDFIKKATAEYIESKKRMLWADYIDQDVVGGRAAWTSTISLPYTFESKLEGGGVLGWARATFSRNGGKIDTTNDVKARVLNWFLETEHQSLTDYLGTATAASSPESMFRKVDKVRDLLGTVAELKAAQERHAHQKQLVEALRKAARLLRKIPLEDAQRLRIKPQVEAVNLNKEVAITLRENDDIRSLSVWKVVLIQGQLLAEKAPDLEALHNATKALIVFFDLKKPKVKEDDPDEPAEVIDWQIALQDENKRRFKNAIVEYLNNEYKKLPPLSVDQLTAEQRQLLVISVITGAPSATLLQKFTDEYYLAHPPASLQSLEASLNEALQSFTDSLTRYCPDVPELVCKEILVHILTDPNWEIGLATRIHQRLLPSPGTIPPEDDDEGIPETTPVVPPQPPAEEGYPIVRPDAEHPQQPALM